MNSKRKGSIAVAQAILYFIEKGITPSIPVTDTEKYDIIAELNGSLKKIQCKYTTDKSKSGSYVVDLRTFGGYKDKSVSYSMYKKEDFDYIFISCMDETKYLIPIEKILGKYAISVGKSWIEYKI